tara:strand:- start:1302 stop:1694 length:393 start_codon:yes stop_codon:yes gene_type:complete
MKSRQSKKDKPKSKYPKYTAKKKPVRGDPIFQNEEQYLDALKEWRRKRELNNISVRKSRDKKIEYHNQLIYTANYYKTLYDELKIQFDYLQKKQQNIEFTQRIKEEPIQDYENYDNPFTVDFNGEVDIMF